MAMVVRRDSGGGSRRKERLDPVRWRAPRRGTVVRAAVVTTLLALAAAVVWADVGADDRCTPREARASPDARERSPGPRTADGKALPVPAGLVGVPVRVGEAASVAVVRPGHRVDVIAAPAGRPAVTLAGDLLVLAASNDEVTAVILVAATDQQARRLAASPPDVRLSITVRPD